MNIKQYKKYLKEISELYGLREKEVRGLFLGAIARAFGSVGASYVWEDGTITVVKNMLTNDNLVVKDYVVSAKQYDKVVKIFKVLIDKYIKSRDELYFIEKTKQDFLHIKVIKESDLYYEVLPLLSEGAIVNYRVRLEKKMLFSNDNIEVGKKIKVVSLGKNKNKQILYVSRFNKLLCERIFEEEFRKLIEVLNEPFEVKEIEVLLNFKNKKIIYKVVWKIIPNGFFIKTLQKRLKERVGNSRIVVKERS